MTILSSGNVGIGTTSPRSPLDVTSGGSNTNGDTPAKGLTITTASDNPTIVTAGTLALQSNTALGADFGASVAFGARYITGSTASAVFSEIFGGKSNATSGNLDGYLSFFTRSHLNSMLERMRIDKDGNVGIGTTTPFSSSGWNKIIDLSGATPALLLHAVGSIQEGNMGLSQGLYIDVSGDPTPANNIITFRTEETASQFSPTARMVIDNAGNVGIGTTSPVAKLSVVGESAFAGGASVGIGYAGTAAPTGGMIIQGNVGIGTTGPASKLDVNGDITIPNNNVLQTRDLAGNLRNMIFVEGVGNSLKIGSTASYDAIRFFPGNTEKVTITTAGNVGIGTTSPVYLADVYKNTGDGNFGVFPGLRVVNASAATHSFSSLEVQGNGETVKGAFIADGLGSGSVMSAAGAYIGTRTNHPFVFATNNTERVRITNAGNVGIGTTGPGAPLEVSTSGIRGAHVGKSATGGFNAYTFQTTNENVTGIVGATATNDVFFLGYHASANTTLGTPVLVWNNSGNVGIGTTGPAQTLEVKNSGTTGTSIIANFINSAATWTGVQMQTDQTNGNGMISAVANGATNLGLQLRYQASGVSTAGLTLNSTGNVGIGTSTPGSALSVSNTAADLFEISRSGTTGAGWMTLRSQSTIRGYIGFESGIGGNIIASSLANSLVVRAENALHLVANGGGATNGITIATAGSVGIGTTSPWGRLSADTTSLAAGVPSFVVGSSTRTDLVVTQSGNVGIGTTGPTFTQGNGGLHIAGVTSPALRLSSATTGSGTWEIYADSAASGGLGFFERQNSITAMYLHESGNVGIGTTSPNYRLQVHGISPSLQLTTSAGSAGSTADDGFLISISNLDSTIYNIENGYLQFGTNNSARMTIQNTGDVGIGTTSPWRTLSVTGTVGFDGLTSSIGAGSLCLDANKQVVYNSANDNCLSSTRDTKRDIEPLSFTASTTALDIITALDPVSFIYKQGDGRTRYGFIAEDTAAVDDILATHNEAGAITGIDDRAILSVVVKGMKELYGFIATLQEQVVAILTSSAEQDARIEELERRIEELEGTSSSQNSSSTSGTEENKEAMPTDSSDVAEGSAGTVLTAEETVTNAETTTTSAAETTDGGTVETPAPSASESTETNITQVDGSQNLTP